VETVQAGTNCLVGADRAAIIEALAGFEAQPAELAPIFGDGHAAEQVAALLLG